MAKDLPLPTGLVASDVYKKHDTGRGHPESAKRLDAIYQAITKSGLDKVPIFKGSPSKAKPKPAYRALWAAFVLSGDWR